MKRQAAEGAITRIVRHPSRAWAVTVMLLRGRYYRLKYRLSGRRVQFGRNFRVDGRLDIRGPGRVIFGDDCTVVSSRQAPVTPYTHSELAVIRFGNRVVLNGTRLGCCQHIEIGEDCLVADARISDSDFHALDPQGTHRWHTTGIAKPVRIGPNAWICSGVMILKGVTVGANAVIGAGAVVTHDVAPRTVVAGNPARKIKDLPAADRDSA